MFFSNTLFYKIRPFIVAALSILLVMVSCSSNPHRMELQKGDLLLCAYEKAGLSSAIDEVTQTQEATHFSHMGMVSIENGDTFVYHASSKKGVCKESVSNFIMEEKASIIEVYRLKPAYLQSIDSIIIEANKLVGRPYNFSYMSNDSGFYCSQLIYHLFKTQNVFALNPMTFKNPESGKFNEIWVDYYKKLGLEIPEGELGCNPNGLAASNKIDRIMVLE